jgi:ABC-type multidrug transport system ATPase subunit
MLRIEASDLSKKFYRRFIFRNLNHTFQSGNYYAVTGSNGSGKSTLLQILCGAMMPNSGKVTFTMDGKTIEQEHHYRYCAVASPYMELIEEYTVLEHIAFHAGLKKILHVSEKEMAEAFQLTKEISKPVKHLSSGNKQRLKLALAFCSDTPVLFLDEPTQNLDQAGIELYQFAIKHYTPGRLVIISSNDMREYGFCNQILNIEDYRNDMAAAKKI